MYSGPPLKLQKGQCDPRKREHSKNYCDIIRFIKPTICTYKYIYLIVRGDSLYYDTHYITVC